MARRTPIITVLAVSAGLLLTACGGSNSSDSSSDKIKGAVDGPKNPLASASSAATGDGRPDVSVPADLHLNFDFDKPSDPKHAAALADAENYIRALDHGIAKQDPEDPAYKFYSLGSSARYAKSQIQAWVKGGWTVTGTDKYFKADTTSIGGGKQVLVTFCRNQGKFFSKSVKTGKVDRNEENLDSYQKFSLLMNSSVNSQVWKTQLIQVQGRVKECQS